MDQSNFQKDLIESKKAQIEQSDQNSGNFHHGNQTTVPEGGQATLQHQHVQENAPQMEQILDQNTKSQLNNRRSWIYLKIQTLNKMLAHHEVLLHNQEILQDPENANQIQKFQGLSEIEKTNLENTIQELQSYAQFVLLQARFRYRYCDLMQILPLIQQSQNTKQELIQFGKLVKNMTSIIIKDNQKLIEEIAVIKIIKTVKYLHLQKIKILYLLISLQIKEFKVSFLNQKWEL